MTWPPELVVAVGEAYRASGAAGGDEHARLAAAVDGYLAAGGDPKAATVIVPEIIRHLGRTRQDWLMETAIRWFDSGRPLRRAGRGEVR